MQHDLPCSAGCTANNVGFDIVIASQALLIACPPISKSRITRGHCGADVEGHAAGYVTLLVESRSYPTSPGLGMPCAKNLLLNTSTQRCSRSRRIARGNLVPTWTQAAGITSCRTLRCPRGDRAVERIPYLAKHSRLIPTCLGIPRRHHGHRTYSPANADCRSGNRSHFPDKAGRAFPDFRDCSGPFRVSARGGTCLRAIHILSFSTTTPNVPNAGVERIEITIQAYSPIPPSQRLIDAKSRSSRIGPGLSYQSAEEWKRFSIEIMLSPLESAEGIPATAGSRNVSM